MDKRVKILLAVFGALILLSGGYYGYVSMTASEEVEKAVAAKPVKKAPAPAPEAGQAAPAQTAPEAAPAPVAGKPAPAPVAGKPAPAPVAGKPAPAPVAGKPAPAPVAGKPAPAPVKAAAYEPVIKAMEGGKETIYKTPEDFLAKTKLSPDEVKALSAKMTADSGKALEAAKAKKDNAATEKAQKDAEMAARLAQQAAAKFPAKQAAQSGERAYSSMGKRDPFMSPLEVPKKYPKVPATASPLERVSTEQLQVKAIMWSSKGYRAMIITPDNLGYTVKVGDTLGNKKGKITKISEKRVYVVEKITDILGDVETRNIVLKLHKEAQ